MSQEELRFIKIHYHDLGHSKENWWKTLGKLYWENECLRRSDMDGPNFHIFGDNLIIFHCWKDFDFL